MAKYYAVKKGRKPGVYFTWDECQEQVKGFSGAEFKSFKTLEEADNFVTEASSSIKKPEDEKELLNVLEFDYKGIRVFTDGSFNVKTKVYGGAFAYIDEEGKVVHAYKLAEADEEFAKSRNVAGEVIAAEAAILFAMRNNIKEITIIHDYEGIAKWADESPAGWKVKTPIAQRYRNVITRARLQGVSLNFIWVRGHIGVTHNELVDKLAKEAVGL